MVANRASITGLRFRLGMSFASLLPLVARGARSGEEKITMADSASSSASTKSRAVLPWILVGVVSLVLAGDLGFRAISYLKGTGTLDPKAGSASGVKNTGPRGPAADKLESKSTVALEPFLVNLADRDAVRFVKVAFQLGMVTEKGSDEFTSNRAVVAATRDSVISLLSTMSSDQILSPEGKSRLREQLKKKVNSLSEAKVADVYIVEFVVQL